MLTTVQEILLQGKENALFYAVLVQTLMERLPVTASVLQESRIILGPKTRNDTDQHLAPPSIHPAIAGHQLLWNKPGQPTSALEKYCPMSYFVSRWGS